MLILVQRLRNTRPTPYRGNFVLMQINIVLWIIEIRLKLDCTVVIFLHNIVKLIIHFFLHKTTARAPRYCRLAIRYSGIASTGITAELGSLTQKWGRLLIL